MKALHELTNSDKAKLLHVLFPQHMEELLQYIKGMSETIIEEQETQPKAWQPNGMFTFESWLSWAQKTESVVNRNHTRLCKNSSLFSSYLFKGYISIFTCYCLTNYVKTRKTPRPEIYSRR
jgi:hypothetical protein